MGCCTHAVQREGSRAGRAKSLSSGVATRVAWPTPDGWCSAVNEDFSLPLVEPVEVGDRQEEAAAVAVERYFEEHRDRVFFSRQIEVMLEREWFHWVTNRALRVLIARGTLRNEVRPLSTGGTVNLMWHRSYRYYRRDAARLIALVEEYADPNHGAALGLQREFMALEGFARNKFVMLGRETREFNDVRWTESDHNLDFIFGRDGQAYGVEVKNTLGYMDHLELQTKVRLCRELSIRPVFVVRMLPKSWINEIVGAGGFALVLKYQLYPWAHRDLARRVRVALDLPVDAPRALQQGTMERFVQWHERQIL
jgi:hypothetical protein